MIIIYLLLKQTVKKKKNSVIKQILLFLIYKLDQTLISLVQTSNSIFMLGKYFYQ